MKKLSIITLLLTLSAAAVAQTYPAGAFVTKWAIKPGGDDITIPTLENNIGIDDLYGNPLPYAPAPIIYDNAYKYTINWGDDPNDPFNEEIITDATPPSHHYENTGANARIVTITITSNNSVDGFPRMAFDFRKDPEEEMALKLRSVEQWGSIRWQSMGRAFWGCKNLKINATDIPDLSQVTHMHAMFQNCIQIDHIPNVNDWNVTNVINMANLFTGVNFNDYIGGWDVTNVKTMSRMFADTDAFNQDIGNWNVSSVENMFSMFDGASAFNQDLGSWDVSNVTDMFSMFFTAVNFNQDLGSWDVSSVTDMRLIFQNARNFDQDLGSWDLTSVTDMAYMFQNAAMSCTNYSATLTGWATNNPSKLSVDLGIVGFSEFVGTGPVFTPREYGTNAADVVRILTNERGWTIDNHIEAEGECLLFEIDPIDDAAIDENTIYSTGLPLVSSGEPVGGISSVTYSLGGADAAVFAIVGTDIVMQPKDFENPVDTDRDNRYEVAIIATDKNGNYDRNDWIVTVENVSETITFTIDDITDISIKENTGYAGPVPSLSGGMPAGQVTYTLEGPDATAFTIDVNSGAVSMMGRDFETPADADMDNVYEVRITATDEDSNSATEDWTVTIGNVIEPANFRITAIGDEQIDENTPYIGPTPIFSDDSDLPIGKVTYTLSGPDATAFTLDERSGIISMEVRDYENPADANGNNVYEVFITATDQDGNTATEDWTVTVLDVLDEQLPEKEGPNISTAFTPNGDGINDTWIIDNLASDASVVIHNRQGTILYESRNYAAKPWDGRYKGDVLPAGSYLFTIRNETDQFRGTIVILK